MMKRTKTEQDTLNRIVSDDARRVEAFERLVIEGDGTSRPEGLRSWPNNPGTDTYRDKIMSSRILRTNRVEA